MFDGGTLMGVDISSPRNCCFPQLCVMGMVGGMLKNESSYFIIHIEIQHPL